MTSEIYPAENSRRTVLMVGDSFGVLKRIAFALQRRGYSVIWGDSGHAGLRVAESDQPDLILCETRLPDGSGIDLCRTIKGSFFCETPVVLVGKHRDEKLDLPRAFSAGADDYIGSFTDWQLIMAKLEWLIQKRTSKDSSRNRTDVHAISPVVSSLN